MSTLSTIPSTVPAPKPPHILHRFWLNITRPHPSVPADEQVKARLLLGLLAVMIGVVVLGGGYQITLELNATTATDWGTIGMIGFSALFFPALYVLARTPRYELATRIFVLLPTGLIVLAFVGRPEGESQLVGWLFYYSMVGPLLASLLLTARATNRVAMLNLAVLLGLLVIFRIDVNPLIDEIVFVIAVPSLLIVSASIREQYLRQIKTQIVELEVAEREAHLARERAERSDQVKSSFLASMSHELRTPLNAIINFTRYVAKGSMGPVNDEQRDTLNEVITSAKHLLNLINDVLDMSKIASGSLKLFVEDDIDLKPVLDQVMSTGRALLVEKSVTLRAEVAADLPTIRADRQRLLQILLNIMSNACKFTDSGEIVLRASRQGDEILLTVQDTGCGIALEDQPGVFEAFKQTQKGLRQGGGTGLGMPITKSLVEAHGGRVMLESTAGGGATFTVALPIRSEQLLANAA